MKKRFNKVYLEISNLCNLRCAFCPGTKRTGRSMNVAEFSALLPKLRPYTDYLYFHLMGEPLCHPDLEAFPCLALARSCAKKGGTACPAMNGANEEAVAMFLADEIGFYDIYDLVSKAVEVVPFIAEPTLDEILEADRLARAAVREFMKSL